MNADGQAINGRERGVIPAGATIHALPFASGRVHDRAGRACRLCLLRAIRVLRHSVRMRRPISFANLSRYFRRQWRCAASRLALDAAAAEALQQAALATLSRQHGKMYLYPFFSR